VANARTDVERREAESLQAAHEAFLRTPVGRARAAFRREDCVFQYSLALTDADPNPVLNGICREGWEVVSCAFMPPSQEKHAATPEQNGLPARTIAHYLFRRCETHRRDASDPF
jgi:hypothetical protein